MKINEHLLAPNIDGFYSFISGFEMDLNPTFFFLSQLIKSRTEVENPTLHAIANKIGNYN